MQGAEGLVFEGAKEILAKNDVKILMEFWPAGLRNLGTDPLRLWRALQESGFTIRLLDTQQQRIRTIEAQEAVDFCDQHEHPEAFLDLYCVKDA